MIKRTCTAALSGVLWRLVRAYRALRKRRAVAANRSLIARVRAEADGIEEAQRMREKGRE